MKQLTFIISVLCLAQVHAQTNQTAEAEPAREWELFRSPNSNVEVGNARMAAQDPAGAIQAYDRAARQLPEDMSVQLNRGLAQLGTGDNASARESLLAATDPNAPTSVRAAAYYDLGLAFYRDGDAAATEGDHRSSQTAFREAADAFRRSLRLQPGNRDAAWNLELSLRRLREEQEQQQEQEQQEQEQQEQQEQEQQEQDQQQQDQDQGDQDQDQDGQEQQDQPDQGEQQDQGDPQDEQDQQDQQGDQGQDSDEQQQQDGSDQGDEDRQNGENDQQGDPQDSQQGEDQNDSWNDPNEGESSGGQRLPNHVERVLDALQDDEQNLERVRARQRAQRDQRRVTQDW